MSCQQASRFIAANNNCSNINSATISNTNNSSSNHNNNSSNNLHNNINNITRIATTEDPYVFTESVPTTPPVLFNTQKSRPRLNDIIAGGTSISFANVQPQQQKLTSTQTNGKLAAIKTQASLATAATITPTLKNVTTQSLATSAAATQNKKVTNVCIVRPQLQQQQQQHVITSCPSLEGELKSISPPPLYTPTPSLWQTPLLIEAPQTTIHAPAPLLPPTQPLTSSSPSSQGVNAAVQSIGNTSLSISTTTTAMAKVAPIVVHTPPLQTSPSPPLASCLPPSKFHNHTLAQHLQKVECLKKPKKSVQPMAAPLPPTSPTQFCEDLKGKTISTNCVEPLDSGKANAVKHSGTEELNEIPVNVIFRMALVPQHQQPNDNKSKKQNKTKFVAPPANTTILSSSASTASPQTKTNVNRKVTATTSTPASRLNHVQQITTSSMQPQQQQSKSKLPAIKQQNGDQDANENSEPLALARPVDEKPLAKSKASNTKSTSNNTRKSTASKSVSSASSNACDYANDPFTVGCSTSKGAVAIVKLSRHRDEDASSVDNSHLATASGLPYCLQNYWFNSCDIRKPLIVADKLTIRSSMREERITSYKQQLRRQAMQLLSTRSLQKLPLHVARRRLVCVDRLLRKYYKQNEKSLPVNVKRCCANGCDAHALEMASHCQQHIVLSAGKEIFLPCTAKFADNTQCKVPVFDITHDLPLCLEHARKRDAYNRLLYEQKPRKTAASSAASIFISETVGGATAKPHKVPIGNRRATAVASNQPPTRKRKAGTGNPVGRPQKRAKKSQEQPAISASVITTTTANQMPRLPTTGLKRKGSTTSLESIASNSQHSTTSSTSQLQHHQQFNTMTTSSSPALAQASAGIKTLPPPALAPLSTGFMGNNCLPQHLFSFGHDNVCHVNKHSSAISPTTEFKDFISNLTFPPHKAPSSTSSSSYPTIESTDANFLNTNSNSNFTSSGMGSTTSLPTADDFLTQDMLSICENSSASSVDTGLGGLSDPELMLGGPDGDDMPLGDTHLLEEHDLENVLNSLPEDAFKELFATVHQHESDEIERAIELADKHLKTLQQTIGSELGDFLDFNDDMLMDNSDMCNPAAVTTTNGILDTTALFAGATATGVGGGNGGTTASADIRGLVQT